MARIKRGVVSHRKHKKLLGLAKGYRMSRHRLVKVAHEAVFHAGMYAYAGRRKKKSEFRRLWIVRISEAVKKVGLSYSQFINKMTKAHVGLDRKVLSDLVVNDPKAFQAVVDKVKSL
ncbi:MAG: 50S ribosomal protein L20 [Candidatus Gottesmanbacteria bacterium GW2011_GWC2_39_8]|uniref:Large ribosomal subunit protein bL20 n=1 Tax=Candidatus Gottesmanbacteria bacterium GW2011_GWC2_39_8 TaxID=1618450 RepID=A0A0G0PUU1_9BACT|nr:MAG: 50S ribosomal protein L20 [Candidatus Gottesmanbacteria bacterium GW2011_GWC2_39_8]